jgi:hypothetical protein
MVALMVGLIALALVPIAAAAAPGPTVTGLSPTMGPELGGTVVTITGTGFSTVPGETSVDFGLDTSATVSCSSSTVCQATSPGGIGTVDVVVTVGGLSSPLTAADRFTYLPAPTVAGVLPDVGVTGGGTSVNVTGTGFLTSAGLQSFTFGGLPATGVACASSTSCTAVTPAHAVGAVDVVASNAGGSDTCFGCYTYAPAPTITSLTVTSGPGNGGTATTINGTNFLCPVGVQFDTDDTFIASCSATAIAVGTPAHPAGPVSVMVTNANGISVVKPSAFTYLPPSIRSAHPSDPGTLVVTYTEEVSCPSDPPTAAQFTYTPSGGTLQTATAISCVPIGATSLSLTGSFGSTGSLTYTQSSDPTQQIQDRSGNSAVSPQTVSYSPGASVGSLSVTSGPGNGGTSTTINGSGFICPATVTFGGTPTFVTACSPTAVGVVTPQHAAGAADVTVTNADGAAATRAGAFTFTPPSLLSAYSSGPARSPAPPDPAPPP